MSVPVPQGLEGGCGARQGMGGASGGSGGREGGGRAALMTATGCDGGADSIERKVLIDSVRAATRGAMGVDERSWKSIIDCRACSRKSDSGCQ